MADVALHCDDLHISQFSHDTPQDEGRWSFYEEPHKPKKINQINQKSNQDRKQNFFRFRAYTGKESLEVTSANFTKRIYHELFS